MSCTKDSLYIFLQSGKYTVLYKRFTIYIYTVRKNATSCTMDSLTVVLPTMRAPIYLGYKNCLPYCLYIHHIIRQPYCTYTIFECNNIVSMTYDDLHGHGHVLCLWFPGFNVKEQTVK